MEVKDAINNKDIHIQILRETLGDLRTENRFIKRTVVMLIVLLALAISGIIFQGLYYQHRLFKFIGDTEFSTEIHMDSDMNHYNNMNVERK